MEINGRTKVVGVFGDPVEHTLSPPMQNRAFQAMGLPYVYVPWHVVPEGLPAAVESVRALSLAGVNLTIPHKVAVMQLLDEVTPQASLIGAVNTIENRAGKLVGHNTDAPGFLRSLQEEAGVSPAGLHVVLLGAGGAARAIGVQMLLSGAKAVTIANRTAAKAEDLCQVLCAVPAKAHVAAVALDPQSADFRRVLASADILINTTAAGMYPHHQDPSIVSDDLLPPHLLVCDIVYTPRQTALLTAAKQAGCKCLPGMGMLAYQGAIAIEIWTGEQAPVHLMKAVLDAALASREADRSV